MKSRVPKNLLFAGLLALLALTLMSASGQAQIITGTTDLPPDGQYVSPTDFHEYLAMGIIIDDPSHDRFAQIVVEPVGEDEFETFNSTFSGTEIGLGAGPFSLTGPVQVLTMGIGSPAGRTGTFDTEIVSMSLTGNVGTQPVIIRQDPNNPSTGQTTITDLGGGQFQVDSFFDVFTELSVDGGSSWVPSSGSTHMFLVPEPGTMVLLALGLISLLPFRRCGRAA